MGCCGNRKKQTHEFADQKWEYINLNDFKAKGCGSPFAYGYLWFSLILSIAVYAVDSFTAVNLIFFDRWSSQIQPAIGFKASRWIFAVCILLSFVNLGFEGIRAYRVMRRGNVAECYLDSLAVRWESIRLGKGQGWRRFLVFAELTDSKKGAEYIAIFTYFSFKSWIRVLLCSGPRQVVNALTLRSVYMAKLESSSSNVGDSILGFFDNIKTLAVNNYQQAVILSGMCFTLVVWIFSALFLITAVLFYVFFLFHWIPRSDGGLSGYCERKVNKALLKVVTKTVNKALAKGESNRMKAELKAAKKNGDMPSLNRVGTGALPTLPNVGPVSDDKLAQMPMMNRSETTTTLPMYESRPSSPANIEMGNLDRKRPMPSRTGTMASSASYSSNAPLMGSAAPMGYGRSGSPEPTLPDIDLSNLPPRPGTANSNRSFGPRPPMGHMNSNSGSSLRTPITETPSPLSNPPVRPYSPSVRAPSTQPPEMPFGNEMGRSSSPGPRHFQAYSPDGGRSSPAPSVNPYRGGTPGPQQSGPNQLPYQPVRSATGIVPPRGPPNGPTRTMTAPIPPRGPQTPVQRDLMSSPAPRSPYGAPQRNMTAPMPQMGVPSDPYANSRGWQGSRGPPGAQPSFDRSGTPQQAERRGTPQQYGGYPRPPPQQQQYERSGTPQSHRGNPYGHDVEAQNNYGY